METQPYSVPSQQEASAKIKEKIDEVRSDRQEQLKQYGQVAIETPKFDESGVMLTPNEQQAELAYRQEHGHSSNETVTTR